MTSSIIVTAPEWRVLRGAAQAFASHAYQPAPEDLDTADALIARGLLCQRADFPAALTPTDEGFRAYGRGTP